MDQLAILLFELAGKLAYLAAILAWWCALFPMLSLPVAGAVALGVLVDWRAGVAAGLGAVALWVAWRLWWPSSFERWVTGRARTRWFRWWRYRRRWQTVMALEGLTADLNDQVLTPALLRIQIGRVADVVDVRVLNGQDVQTWQTRSSTLRHSFRAIGLRVRPVQAGRVRLEVIHRDILRKPIPLPRVVRDAKTVDLEALPVGMTQLGAAWELGLAATHVLVAGTTGAGKGSVAWSLIAALGPRIAEGSVVLWVLDPKGGAEFGFGESWFDRFAYDNTRGALELLREAARVLLARSNRIRPRIARKLSASTDEPFIVLIIDEAASLTEYYADKKVKEEIERLLGLILTMGRAAGIVVVGFVQDPSKEVMRLRQLYPTRIAMRLVEPTQTTMVLGPTAGDRGAAPELISPKTPGVGFVQITPGADLTDSERNEEEELGAEIERVRAYNVTDDDIGWIIATYRPPRRYSGDRNVGPAAAIDLDEYLWADRRNDGHSEKRSR
ncbi:FtsK/SpoIIIE domain-containing protein [Nocardia sp. NPDC004068]|uniref:FtsK/SpoIIIE domain-containing protein n=1 Tax=Nocardia sp. NPDC004068 TaxID=3364303 RepID=UPI0036A4B78D